jgi:hypothetical protein
MILPISASQVARITDVSNWRLALTLSYKQKKKKVVAQEIGGWGTGAELWDSLCMVGITPQAA